MNVSAARLALIAAAALFVPPLAGIRLPGGLLATEGVDVDQTAIVLHTWPWALSIAVVTWLFLRGGSDPDSDYLAWSGFVIVAGAALGYLLSAPLRKATDDVQFELGPLEVLSENDVARILAGGTWLGRIGVLALIVLGVVLMYAVLYGLPLWIAGLACGVLLGRQLNAAFPPRPSAASIPTDGDTQQTGTSRDPG
jgi:hypothetical protein